MYTSIVRVPQQLQRLRTKLTARWVLGGGKQVRKLRNISMGHVGSAMPNNLQIKSKSASSLGTKKKLLLSSTGRRWDKPET